MGVATVMGVMLQGKLKKQPMQREIVLVLTLWVLFFVSSVTALEPDLAWGKWFDVTKIFFIMILAYHLDWDRRWVRYMTMVLALSIGLIGIKGTLFGIKTGGMYNVMGPPGSFLEANTSMAVALVMSLPLLLILAHDDLSSRRFKLFCQITIFFSAFSTVLTYSRGGVLGLVVVGAMLLYRSRYKTLAIPIAALAIAFVMSFVPGRWTNRMETIQNYEQEHSAMSRIVIWSILWRFAQDHPLTGGGFRMYSNKVSDAYLYQVLPPDQVEKHRGSTASAHSIWFAVLGEHGFIALFVYIALIVSTFMSVRRLRRIGRSFPQLAWIENYGALLNISIWAFLVSGSFLDVAYFEYYFHLIGLVVILKNIVQRELAVAPATQRVSPVPQFAAARVQGTLVPGQPTAHGRN